MVFKTPFKNYASNKQNIYFFNILDSGYDSSGQSEFCCNERISKRTSKRLKNTARLRFY